MSGTDLGIHTQTSRKECAETEACLHKNLKYIRAVMSYQWGKQSVHSTRKQCYSSEKQKTDRSPN